MNKNEFFANLPDELKERLKTCKTEEEIKALLKGAQIELPDELLEAVSGGMYLGNDCDPHFLH